MATRMTRAFVRAGAPPSRPSTSRKVENGKKKLEEIAQGDFLTGRVRKVLEHGLVVNVKAEVDALLHRNELDKDKDRFEDFKKGQQMVARVKEVDRKRKKLQLTLRNGGYVEWRRIKARHLQQGKVYSGVVKKLKATPDEDGWSRVREAFVDIGAQCDAHLASAQGVPGVGTPVQVRILPGGTDPELVRVRRRVSAVLVADVEGEGSPQEEQQQTTPKEHPRVEEVEEEEEVDELDKYDYLDDIY